MAKNSNNKPLRIAVSANFSPVLTKLIPLFLNESGIDSEIISGSSGTLYQQILHGAPYDMFLSADDIHPQRLADADFIVAGSLHTYAIGQLAFWSASKDFSSEQDLSSLLLSYSNNTSNSAKIAMANPNTAPYGQRAFETLESLNLWNVFQNKLIIGINVSQTFQQVRSHAVGAGFVALSQLKINNLQGLTVPEALYNPIKQQLVILKNSKKIAAAQQLCAFLLKAKTQESISQYGYKKIESISSAKVISTTPSQTVENSLENSL
ncbi:molybdate ABC transporter substrate-binding protein [Pseudocolwellia sp. HL-MZ19]|uniref:molybdate ABC transporter substrate-binding protein n=1 Tax=unclassified Pseudocolwellia TaxID=2848178 RepID=UPI003CECA9E1